MNTAAVASVLLLLFASQANRGHSSRSSRTVSGPPSSASSPQQIIQQAISSSSAPSPQSGASKERLVRPATSVSGFSPHPSQDIYEYCYVYQPGYGWSCQPQLSESFCLRCLISEPVSSVNHAPVANATAMVKRADKSGAIARQSQKR
jgi:hypothetical protein